MGEELYSRPLSREARRAMIEFIESYLESMGTSKVDEKAELAKEKALEALNTDIDILVFAMTLASMYSKEGTILLRRVLAGTLTSREAARLFVDIAEKSRQIDKGMRTN